MRRAAIALTALALGSCTSETGYQVAWHATNVFCLARATSYMNQILTTPEDQHAGGMVCDALHRAPAAAGPPDQLPAITQ